MNGKKQTKIPYKFSSRFIFEDSLCRIIKIIEDAKKIEDMVMSTDLPLAFTNDNTPMKFSYYLGQASIFNSYAEITWVLSNEAIKTPINMTFNFTENTLENTVLIVFELSLVKRELIPEESTDKIITIFKKSSSDIINQIGKLLQNDKKDIYHYQSQIFNYSREKLMPLLLELNQIMFEKGLFASYSLSNGEIKEGTIITLNLLIPPKEVKIKVNKIKNNENDKKWTVEYLPLNEEYKETKVTFKLIKLDNDKTLLYEINEFVEHIESDVFNSLTEKKKKVFQLIEDELRIRYGS